MEKDLETEVTACYWFFDGFNVKYGNQTNKKLAGLSKSKIVSYLCISRALEHESQWILNGTLSTCFNLVLKPAGKRKDKFSASGSLKRVKH